MIDMLIGFVERFLDILVTQTFLKPISAMASIAWTRYSVTVLKVIKPSMLVVMRSISNELYQPDPAWSGFVADFINKLTGGKLTSEQIITQGIGLNATGAMENLGDAFLKPMLQLVMPSPDEVNRDPMKAANRFLGINLQFNMASWLLHVLADTYSLGRVKGLITLPTAISRSFGFGRLSRFALGPAFNYTVVKPMEKLFNQIYTPENYTRGEAINLVKHGVLGFEEYLTICLEQGLPPSKAAALYELSEKELSDAWLARLVRMGWLTEGDIQKELTRRGFSPERSVILARLIKDDRKLDLIDKVISAAGDLYKDGILDRTKLEGYLSKAAYTADEIELFIIQQELEKSRRRYLTQAQVVQLWINKKLGRVECKNYLVSDLNMTPEDAELYMSLKSPGV